MVALAHVYLTRLSPSIEINLTHAVKKSLCANIRDFLKSVNTINANAVNVINGRHTRLANTCLLKSDVIAIRSTSERAVTPLFF